MSSEENIKSMQAETPEPFTAVHLPSFPPNFRGKLITDLNALIETFTDKANFDLSNIQRRRLISSGIRNYGFLDKASDLAAQHLNLLPPKFDHDRFKDMIRDLEFIRDLLSIIRGFDRAVSNALLVYGDDLFRMSLRFYNSVRELARTGDAEAVAVFNMLRPFFNRSRRKNADEPTDTEVERDMRALLHGSKEGRIVVENEKPHLAGGKHVVSDETHKDKSAFKEKIQGLICGQCGEENQNHAKFCINCGGKLI